MRIDVSSWPSLVRAGVVAGLLANAALANAQSEEEAKALRDQKAIQAILMGYADKYTSVMAQDMDDISASMPNDINVRKLALGYKLHSARAALEIATGPNPEASLVDMLVFSRLQRIAIEDPWSKATFGDNRQKLIDSARSLEKEIWDTGARYLEPAELAELQALIARWRKQNPDTRYVFYIRFNDFAAARLESTLANKVRKGGFLVDVSDVSRSADEAILLAERALHVTNRLPLLLSWEVESLYLRLAGSAEARTALDRSGELTASLARFTTSMEKLPRQISNERKAAIEQLAKKLGEERGAAIRDVGTLLASERHAAITDLHGVLASERAAMFTELDARRDALSEIADLIRTSLTDADKLAVHLGDTGESMNKVLLSADKLMGRFDKGPEAAEKASEPFNLASYVEAIRELTLAIQEANTLVLSAERIVGAEAPISGIFDRVLWVGTLLIFILCISAFFTMLIYRAAARRIFVDAHQ